MDRIVATGLSSRVRTTSSPGVSFSMLRQHFRQMGFRRVGRTRYDALSLSQVTPTLEDIVRPQA
jgi:hypothetical protein